MTCLQWAINDRCWLPTSVTLSVSFCVHIERKLFLVVRCGKVNCFFFFLFIWQGVSGNNHAHKEEQTGMGIGAIVEVPGGGDAPASRVQTYVNEIPRKTLLLLGLVRFT